LIISPPKIAKLPDDTPEGEALALADSEYAATFSGVVIGVHVIAIENIL